MSVCLLGQLKLGCISPWYTGGAVPVLMYSSANEETICGCYPVHDMLTAVAVALLCTAQDLRVLKRHRRAGYGPSVHC